MYFSISIADFSSDKEEQIISLRTETAERERRKEREGKIHNPPSPVSAVLSNAASWNNILFSSKSSTILTKEDDKHTVTGTPQIQVWNPSISEVNINTSLTPA